MRVRTSRTHRMADRLAHAPHLTVAALVDRDAQHAGLGGDTLAGAVTPSSSSTPSRRRRSAARRRAALDLGEILLLDAEARMGEAVGELAVVGEQQQPLGVGVEPADREHPRLGGHELDHRRPAVRCRPPWSPRRRACSAGSRRAPAARRSGTPSTSTAVALGVDPPPEHGDLAVDRDPSGRDQVLARRAGCRSRRAASTFCSRSPSPSSASAAHCSQRVSVERRHRAGVGRRPRSSVSTTSAPGTNSADRRQVGRASRARASRGTAGVVPNSTAWPGPGSRADLGDVAALLERAQHAVGVRRRGSRRPGPATSAACRRRSPASRAPPPTAAPTGRRARTARRTAPGRRGSGSGSRRPPGRAVKPWPRAS